MKDNEKLIEEAAKSIYGTRDDAYDMDVWEQLDSVQQERYVCDARAALAVFEKAQGEPSDAQVEAALQEWWYGNHEDTWESKMRAALRAAGGLR